MHPVSDDEIDLVKLWEGVWQAKWIIILSTTLVASIAIMFALSLPNFYRAEIILTPSNSNSSAASKLTGRLGGLASLAGINIQGDALDKTSLALELIKTWAFIEGVVLNNKIAPEVFAGKWWDKRSNTLLYDEKLFDSGSSTWVRKVDPESDRTPEPSGWELYKKVLAHIDISRDDKTGIITVGYEHVSPHFAKQFVDLLISEINREIKSRDRLEAMQGIKYLEEQINKTNNADMQSIFYQLIEDQTKTLMLAEISKEYVFKTLSASKVPEEISRPNRKLIVILGALLGFVMSALVFLFKALLKQQNQSKRV